MNEGKMEVNLNHPPDEKVKTSVQSLPSKRRHPLRRIIQKVKSATVVILVLTLIAFILTIVLFVIVYTVGTVKPVSGTRNYDQLINDVKLEKVEEAPQGEKGERGDQGRQGNQGPQDNSQNPPLEEWQSGTCVIELRAMYTNYSTYHFKFIKPFLAGNPILTGSLCYEEPSSDFQFSLHNVTDKGFALTILGVKQYLFSLSTKEFPLPLNFQFFGYVPSKNKQCVDFNPTSPLETQDYWEKELANINI